VRDWDVISVFYWCSSVLPTSFVEEAIFSSTYVLGFFVKDQMVVAV
jgi:hypothetical protein